MLDEKDIQSIAGLIIASEEKTADRIQKTEELLLNELAHVQTYLEKRIDQVRENLDELQQYYRITKLENDNTAILLKMIDELSTRVAELENKIA